MTNDPLAQSLKSLKLFGLLAQIEDIRHQPWIQQVVAIESEDRLRRSLVHRLHSSGLPQFKPLCDFDWTWPRELERALVDELCTLKFIAEGSNVIFLGPNGVGKTMLLCNLAHLALQAGHTVLVRTASDLLTDLVKQESSAARIRRLAAYVRPSLLCIDEVGYLSYDNRHADLLFEVVTRRYEKQKSIVLTTNKPFAEWTTTFPNAACVVTLVDRLTHRAEVVTIDAESYRLHEAEERKRSRAAERKRRFGRAGSAA